MSVFRDAWWPRSAKLTKCRCPLCQADFRSVIHWTGNGAIPRIYCPMCIKRIIVIMSQYDCDMMECVQVDIDIDSIVSNEVQGSIEE